MKANTKNANTATATAAPAAPKAIIDVALPVKATLGDLLMNTKPDAKALYYTFSGTIPLPNGGEARYTGNVFIPASNFSPAAKDAARKRYAAKKEAADANAKPTGEGQLLG